MIPARLRRRYGISEGSFVITQEAKDGILIRPASIAAVDIYTPEEKAMFLLSNALDAADYAAACKEVHKMGLDPAKIKHRPPR